MTDFDPISTVEDSHLILDHGDWPNFHDAEVEYLNIWFSSHSPLIDMPHARVDLYMVADRQPGRY